MNTRSGKPDLFAQNQVDKILKDKAQVIGSLNIAQNTQSEITQAKVMKVNRRSLGDLAAKISIKWSDSLQDISLLSVPAIVFYSGQSNTQGRGQLRIIYDSSCLIRQGPDQLAVSLDLLNLQQIGNVPGNVALI